LTDKVEEHAAFVFTLQDYIVSSQESLVFMITVVRTSCLTLPSVCFDKFAFADEAPSQRQYKI
jgi:hypothetical protein